LAVLALSGRLIEFSVEEFRLHERNRGYRNSPPAGLRNLSSFIPDKIWGNHKKEGCNLHGSDGFF